MRKIERSIVETLHWQRTNSDLQKNIKKIYTQT